MSSLAPAKLATALYFAIALGAAVAQLRLVVQFLPPASAAAWILAITFGGYLLFFDFGLSPTVTREISFALGSGNAARAGAIAASARRAFTIVAAVALAIAAPAGAALLVPLVPSHDAAGIAGAWCALALGVALALRANVELALLDGLGEIAAARALKGAAVLAGLALAVALLYAGLAAWAFGIAMAAQGLLLLVAAAWFARARLSGPARADRAVIRELLPPSLRWATMQLGALLILNTGSVVVAYRVDLSAVAPFEAMLKANAAFLGFAILLVAATVPAQSRLFAAGSTPAVRALLLRNAKFATFAVATIAIAFAANAGPLVTLWLGTPVAIDARVAWTLAAAFALEAHHASLAHSALAAGHVVFARPALIAGVLNVALAVALAPHLGPWGVALALLVAQLLTNNWYVPRYTLRLFGIDLRDYLASTLAPVAAGIAVVALAQAAIAFGIADLSARLAASLALALAVLLGSAWRFIRALP